ncbi:MAG: hypothetical protein ACYC6L_06920 [Anaerolineae bacterium]
MSASVQQKRVIEAEIRPIAWKTLKLPKIDMEPVRCAAEQVLITGIGMGVLLARGVQGAVRAAYNAGSEAAEHPGPVTGTLLKLVRPQNEAECEPKPTIRQVPVLPIANYHELSESEIITRMEGLSVEQLHVIRTFEQAHLNRPVLLAAIQSILQKS